MFKISVANKEYSIPAAWEDITVSQAKYLQVKVNELPETVKEFYIPNNEDKKTLTDDDILLQNEFERNVTSYLCGLDDIVNHVNNEDIKYLFDNILIRFVVGVMGYVDYEQKKITEFDYKGKTFYFPKSGKDITNDDTPLSEMSAQQFCDASDIASANNLAVAALFIATLCAGKYNETEIMKMADMFNDLTMNVYFEALFLLRNAHDYLSNECPECYGKGKAKGTGKSITWNEVLLQVTDEKPSEIPFIQSMKCYDFMRFLNVKYKIQKDKWQTMSKLMF
ncbi:MAG: hypothetical protein LBF04_04090 [Prevotellaceae bacterium]|jgi:hypothetical protein|nr:hypothetical protein [Prevotellaceae bacterium]